jgi:hypothetical protein
VVFDAHLTAPRNKPRLYRCDEVLGAVALHRTTISR